MSKFTSISKITGSFIVPFAILAKSVSLIVVFWSVVLPLSLLLEKVSVAVPVVNKIPLSISNFFPWMAPSKVAVWFAFPIVTVGFVIVIPGPVSYTHLTLPTRCLV